MRAVRIQSDRPIHRDTTSSPGQHRSSSLASCGMPLMPSWLPAFPSRALLQFPCEYALDGCHLSIRQRLPREFGHDLPDRRHVLPNNCPPHKLRLTHARHTFAPGLGGVLLLTHDQPPSSSWVSAHSKGSITNPPLLNSSCTRALSASRACCLCSSFIASATSSCSMLSGVSSGSSSSSRFSTPGRRTIGTTSAIMA